MTCSMIFTRCIFDMYIDMYIAHVYYVFSHHVDDVVVLFIKCIMSMLIISIINDFSFFKLNLRCITNLNLQLSYNV
jgi:hypothetical protein